MTAGQKTTFSLFISTLLFGIFAFFAFSDLFRVIEITFYNNRTTQEITKRLEVLGKAVEFYKSDTFKVLETVVSDPSFKTVFNPTQSREDILRRNESISSFFRGFRGPGILRILDSNLDKIHFSTVESDVLSKTDFSLTYKNYKALKNQIEIGPILGQSLERKNYGDRFSISFFLPMKDTVGNAAGWAAMTLSLEDLKSKLFEKGAISALENFYLLTGDRYVVSLAGGLDSKLQDRVLEVLSNSKVLPVENLAQVGNDLTLLLLTYQEGAVLSAAVIPQDMLRLNWPLKIIILVAGFSVIFLLVFFVFNFRPDSVVALNKKVKRFQIQVIKGYLDQKDANANADLLTNLNRNSEKIKKEMHDTLGRVRKRDKAWATQLIDKSWEDILDILGAKQKTEEAPPGISADRIEKIIKEALERGRFSISVSQGAMAAIPPVAQSAEADHVEELDELDEVEEVEELTEASSGGEVEELEELGTDEALEAGVEEPEELEMLPSEDGEDADEVIPLDDEFETEEALVPVAVLEQEMAEAQALEDASAEEVLETLEEDLSDSDEAEEAELLEAMEDESASFPLSEYSPRVSGQLGILPTAADHGEAEEMEELDESEEVGMAVALNPEVTSKHQAVRVYTLTEITEYYLTHTLQAFNVEDNVLQISDEYFRSRKVKPDPAFASLVDSVMGPSASVKDTTTALMVSPHFVGFAEDEEDRGPKVWRWSGEGFDLDKYLTYYKTSETGLYKALIDLTTGFEAFAGALLIRDDDGLSGAHSVGFSDQGKERLNFGPGNELFDEFLAEDALFLFDGEPGHNRYLYKNLHPKDLRYIRAAVFAPVIYKHRQGYLLLAYKAYPHQPLELLRPRDL